ncbi:hypothetical protein [Rubrivirga sp. IMCC45206]|uniref:hypothetical protein n=1 Tax=Rubrivirga sp. IMCC45206 TaxID=3391614 RepID=UPI0039902C16
MRRLAVLIPLLALAACDSDEPPAGPVTFQGVEVEAVGDAQLAVVDGALVVSGLGGSREGGFRVAGQPARLDVETDPIAIPAGGRFGATVEASGATVAELFTEGRADGALDFQVDFGGPVDVAVVRYRLNGAVVLAFELDVLGRTSGERRAQSAGSGEGDTGSTHVIRENGRYVVVSDSDGDGSRRAGGCAGFRMTPPAGVLPELPGAICADWVEVEPLVATPMPVGDVAVRARGVGQFTVRQLAAR